jgi:hypothetical protein
MNWCLVIACSFARRRAIGLIENHDACSCKTARCLGPPPITICTLLVQTTDCCMHAATQRAHWQIRRTLNSESRCPRRHPGPRWPDSEACRVAAAAPSPGRKFAGSLATPHAAREARFPWRSWHGRGQLGALQPLPGFAALPARVGRASPSAAEIRQPAPFPSPGAHGTDEPGGRPPPAEGRSCAASCAGRVRFAASISGGLVRV